MKEIVKDTICEVFWFGCKIFGGASALVDQACWKVFGRGIHSGKGKV